MDSIIKKIASSKILLDVLIAFEDFLDSNDLYVYKNWFDGEVVEGPIISRYWVTVTLKYPYRKMPDPDGAERLVKNGVSVKYVKSKEEIYFKDMSMTDSNNISGLGFATQTTLDKTPKPKYMPIWLITITMPRRFIESVIEQDLVDFNGKIDLSTIADARTSNIDVKNSFSTDQSESNTDEEIEL